MRRSERPRAYGVAGSMADQRAAARLPCSPPPPRRRGYIPFSPPAIGEEEIREVVEVLRSPWITTGPRAKRFETEFAAYVGAPAALALSSCTAALHTALVTLGIGPGDEVITTPMTFAASVNVIEHVGARPVLVDVEPDTANIDAAAVAAAVTSRAKAILPVHYAGHPVNLDPILALAQAHGLVVLEDAAHALSAAYQGRRIGSGLNPVAFSFYATKNITTAEGGMLVGDPEFVERARVVSLHGMSRDAWRRYEKGQSWRYDVVQPGFKYNMTDIQAALGIAQLPKAQFQKAITLEKALASPMVASPLTVFDCCSTTDGAAALLVASEKVARRYTEAFADEPALQVPVCRAGVEHAWHLYVLRLHPAALRIGRDRFIEELAARHIGTSVHFIPIHLHSYYREKYGYTPASFPVAYENYCRMISLPLHPRLSDQDVADVIDAVRDVARTYRR